MKASEQIKQMISNIIESSGWSKTEAKIKNNQLDALREVLKHVERQEKQTRNIFRWLLGYKDFPVRGASGPYWWRTYLRAKIKKLGIEFK